MSLRADRLDRPAHLLERVRDQRLVVVAPGIGDPRDAQAVLVEIVGQRHAVALVGQHLADHLDADHVVVVEHRVAQRIAPQPARAGLDRGPFDRQRPLAQPDIAAVEILVVA